MRGRVEAQDHWGSGRPTVKGRMRVSERRRDERKAAVTGSRGLEAEWWGKAEDERKNRAGEG